MGAFEIFPNTGGLCDYEGRFIMEPRVAFPEAEGPSAGHAAGKTPALPDACGRSPSMGTAGTPPDTFSDRSTAGK